jgi:hypothetical protein
MHSQKIQKILFSKYNIRMIQYFKVLNLSNGYKHAIIEGYGIIYHEYHYLYQSIDDDKPSLYSSRVFKEKFLKDNNIIEKYAVIIQSLNDDSDDE